MPKRWLKNVKIVTHNSGASSAHATNRAKDTDVPDLGDTESDTRDANSSNSTTLNLSETNSGEMGDQDLSNLDPIDFLNAVDSYGQHKTRGPITLKDLWKLPLEDRILVTSNSAGQPVGKEAQLFSGFLGMVARDGKKCPIHYETWRHVPDDVKHATLNFIETRFCLEISTKIVLKSLGKKWRNYKHDLKKAYFNRSDGIKTTLRKVPPHVVKWQYRRLVAFWYSEKGEKKEKVGVTSRKLQKYTHTSGSKSFARKQHEMEDEAGKKVGRVELYIATHTKKDGTPLNTETQQIVEKFQEKLSAYEASSSNIREIEDSIFTEVVGKERNGWVRGLGFGPTPTSYYGVSSSRRYTCQTESEEVLQLREKLQTMTEQLEQIESERDDERARMEAERVRMESDYVRVQEQLNHIMSFMQQFVGPKLGGPPSLP
ncbi:hypothetical protein PTKIN_Ptkin11bG0129700 [Pterospermum kingtungense]